MAIRRNLLLWVTRVGVVPVIIEIIRYLYENDRLTEEIQKLLQLLKSLVPVQDPVEKLRKAIEGTEDYLHNQQELPLELSETLIKRVYDMNRRLDLAESLDGTARKQILKGVRIDFFDVLEQTLQLENPVPDKIKKPGKLRARFHVVSPKHRKAERKLMKSNQAPGEL